MYMLQHRVQKLVSWILKQKYSPNNPNHRSHFTNGSLISVQLVIECLSIDRTCTMPLANFRHFNQYTTSVLPVRGYQAFTTSCAVCIAGFVHRVQHAAQLEKPRFWRNYRYWCSVKTRHKIMSTQSAIVHYSVPPINCSKLHKL